MKKIKSPRNFTREEARQVVQQWGDMGERFREAKREIDSVGRWTENYTGIFEDQVDKQLWRFTWSEGKTERQSEAPYEYGEVNPVRVKPQEITVIEYVAMAK